MEQYVKDFVGLYCVIAVFFEVFNLNWMFKDGLTCHRFIKYTLLALVWPFQFWLHFTNRSI